VCVCVVWESEQIGGRDTDWWAVVVVVVVVVVFWGGRPFNSLVNHSFGAVLIMLVCSAFAVFSMLLS